MRHINEAGLALVKEFEGCRLTAYPDPGTGGAPWTIGYGSTKGVTPGMTITEEEAERRLRDDLEAAEQCVERSIKGVILTDDEFSACVALSFNIGCGAFSGSTLARKLNAGDREGAALEFRRWSNAGGKVMAGLVRRRAAEAQLFSA